MMTIRLNSIANSSIFSLIRDMIRKIVKGDEAMVVSYKNCSIL